jgi:hypothetical protein
MAFRAKLGTVAPLKPAGGYITSLENKFYQAADGDDLRFVIGFHYHLIDRVISIYGVLPR